MKQASCILSLALVILFSSCNQSVQKRVLVLYKGDGKIDKDNTSIELTSDNSSTHNDEVLEYFSGSKQTFTIKKTDGEVKLDAPDEGYYIINAKNDTIIGSYQQYSSAKSDTIKQDVIKKGIDSLELLVQGKNVSAANRNFFILPYTIVKITSNADAFVVAPFHKMNSIETQEGKEPEVYRFWGIKEIREDIERMKGLTSSKKK